MYPRPSSQGLQDTPLIEEQNGLTICLHKPHILHKCHYITRCTESQGEMMRLNTEITTPLQAYLGYTYRSFSAIVDNLTKCHK